MTRLQERGWFQFPKAYILCLGLALAVSLPALKMGLFLDDYYHVLVLEGEEAFAGPLDLFCFAPGDAEALRLAIDRGPYPWWTLPELRMTFFRPASSALIWFDQTVFGRRFAWHHAHSVLWYLLFVLVWGLILRRSLPTSAAVLALAVFAVDDVHWIPVAWLANRNALAASVPAFLGLLAHVRWREDGWKPGLPLSVLGYAAGLSFGETALGAFGYLAAYELFATREPRLRRLGALVPAGLLGAGYLLLYKALGYGAYGSGSYIDPVREPLAYLANAPGRMLALIGAQLLSVPAEGWLFYVWLRPFFVLAGLLGMTIFALLLRASWHGLDARMRRALGWMIPGALLSLLPVVATFPSNRLLVAPSMGASVAMAAILGHWWQRGRVLGGGSRHARPYNAACWYLAVTGLVLAPAAWPVQSHFIAGLGRAIAEVYKDAELDEDSIAGQHVIMPAAPDALTALYPAFIRAVESYPAPLALPAAWHALSAAPYTHRLTRTHDNRFELEVVDGRMMESEVELLVRALAFPLRRGQQVAVEGFTATVLDTDDTGVVRLAFEFDCVLEDPSLVFLIWRDGGLRRMQLPAVGESALLPRELGILDPKLLLKAGLGIQ